jgi:AraC-like DNA-binding protein
MTRRANELPSGAISRASSSTLPPTRPASELRIFADALQSLGFNSEALLGRARVKRSDLNDPDARVPCAAWEAVIGGAYAAKHIPNLPAHLAYHTPMGSSPLLDYLVLTTDTVGDALKQLCRYFHMTSAPDSLEVVEEKECVRLILTPGLEPFAAQYSTAIILHHLRAEVTRPLEITCVSLIRAPENRQDLERLLGCHVLAPSTWTGIEFPKSAMGNPLSRRDPILRSVLEGRASSTIAAPIRSDSESVLSQIRTVLSPRLGEKVPGMSEMARRLALSPRTLQRRLTAEGKTYKELLDTVRREHAELLLADRSLAVAEVGYLLGFSEPSAFHRAFKRWKGMSPLEYRNKSDRSGKVPVSAYR